MSIAGISFIFWRIAQIITLIPILGMLAWFVDYYTSANTLTPRDILILFIVATIGAAWTIGTLFLYARAKHSAHFVAFVDLLFVGALIGAVYEMRAIAKTDCAHFENSSYSKSLWDGYITFGGTFPKLVTNKQCAMLKASWALAIMNTIFFFFTFLLALLVHRHHKEPRVVVKRETTHYSTSRRNSHRSPRRSHHSSRRSSHYV